MVLKNKANVNLAFVLLYMLILTNVNHEGITFIAISLLNSIFMGQMVAVVYKHICAD